MSSSFGIDAHELRLLGDILLGAPARLAPAARASIAKGAYQVKKDWQANAEASSGAHAPLYPRSITYDLQGNGVMAGAVIGPDKDLPQGALGNLLEYGSHKNPAHDDGGRALLAEGARLEKALADDAERAVFGAL